MDLIESKHLTLDTYLATNMSDPPWQDSEHACGEVCESQTANLVLRADSEKGENNTVIYSGDFASGNTIAEDEGVMCFEMEAAGPTNHFPRLTVPSMYDHSDSRELNNWQAYAADTAAVYTKELLEGREVYETERLKRIFEWLSPPDPSANYTKALETRHDGTGLWFIHGDVFEEWKRRPGSFLWLHGIPGCGKTVLTSTIIARLEQDMTDQVLLYFYFDFTDTDKQSLNSVLRSLVKQICNRQLCKERPDASQSLDYLWASHEQGTRQPSTKSLQSTLQSMLSGLSNVSVVLDALDESTTISELLAWLRTLFEGNTNDCRLLVTSRRMEDIELALQSWTRTRERISIQRNEVNKDIGAYIKDKVRNGDEFKRWQYRPDVQQQIEYSLMEKADGMYVRFVLTGRV
jgi:hypothetical protein